MRRAFFRLQRSSTAFVHDVVMAALSFCLSLTLRLGENTWYYVNDSVFFALSAFTAVCAIVFVFMGLYRGIWRYASLNDVATIVKAVTLALLVFLAVTFMVTRLEAVPRSGLLINWFVLIFLLSAPRMAYRVIKDHSVRHLLERSLPGRVPVLVIGVDDNAEVFIREMARDVDAPYEVLGLVGASDSRTGRQIRGVPVLGSVDELPKVLREVAARGRTAQRLILTRPLAREAMERLLDLADARGMTIAQMPRLTDFHSSRADSEGEAIELRPVAIEDLLGRTQTKLDRGVMRRLIEGRRILVTGAGGSIGAELVRQIATLRPTEIALLDNAEYNLYAIDLELSENHPELERRAILADVRDRLRLWQVMRDVEPHLVFHAAALKHVPMVEANPVEGVLTNVIGTRNVADACLEAGVTAMVLISTDKAINPPNVMGATKRLAETYCQALDLAEHERAKRQPGKATRFVTLRFGNVLGSTGSVVPLFQRQLAAGGPLTVTHPEVKRYFMTISEAVELVLEGAAHSIEEAVDDAGKIYVLDMGEPVKIDDLARQMIRLAGMRPDRDIEIVYSGLRPGEKLSEELFYDHEPMLQTPHPGLKLAAPRTSNLELLSRGLDELAEKAEKRRRVEVLALLRRLVPEYRDPYGGRGEVAELTGG
ncbi:MAG: polysaccharide biosynthesis protein [Kiloniellales bacterium]|nr:polysaccharide biosynthesis protein [Kiloniellales bacterium]